MYTTKHKHNGSKYDLSGDIYKIKSLLADTTYDLNGRTREIMEDSFDNIKEKSMKFQGDVARYTAKRPFKTIGIALLVGTALGWFLSRK